MRRIPGPMSLAVVLCALCACPSAPDSTSGPVEPAGRPPLHVPIVGDRYEYGPLDALLAGQWARYRITRGSATQELTLACVERAGDRTWIEVVEEGEPRRASLRRITPDGAVERALLREVPAAGEASGIEVQRVVQSPAPPVAARPQSVDTKTNREDLRGPIDVTIERALFRDEELGREYVEEHAWSKSVPSLYAGSDAGGLVRRVTPAEKIELLDHGAGYKALVPPGGK